MNHEGVMTSGRVTHETGSVDDIATGARETQHEAVAELLTLPGVEEALVLSTCNRVEAYVVTPTAAAGREAVATFFATTPTDALRVSGHEDSLEHLLRVAAGLESVVLGEDQILGQLRDAYGEARAAGGVGPLLDTVATKALHVGERARTETAINDGVVSLGSAAVRLAGQTVDLEGATVLVVGAGEMGRVVARSLESAGVGDVTIANRTTERAVSLAADLDVPAAGVSLEALPEAAGRVDLVVTATGSDEPVVTEETLPPGTPVVVDLGAPRDVSPAVAETTTVLDLDDLESVTRATREQRAEAAGAVEALVDAEHDQLLEHLKRSRADEAIAAMYAGADVIKGRELETALDRLEELGADPVHEEVVAAMADALVNQLLAPPTQSLRDAAAADDWDTINTALRLFDPTVGAREDSESGPAVDPAVGAVEDD